MLREGEDNDLVLYSNNLGMKSFQWELWQCCNNLCSFCYLGANNRHTNKDRQLRSLRDLLRKLEALDFNVYNNVSLIGGEFFQGQLDDSEVHALFFEAMEKLADLYLDKKLGSIWISATLTIGNQEHLYETLDFFQKAGVKPHPDYGASGVWICTSWDAEGRFRSEKSRSNWEFHMKNMSENYPAIKKNTTIILMQPFLEMYIDGRWNPNRFVDDFGTFLFYKQPAYYERGDNNGSLSSLIESYQDGTISDFMLTRKKKTNEDLGFNFYPERKVFRKFLLEYARRDRNTFDRICNIKFRADELHKNFNSKFADETIERDKASNFESEASVDTIPNEACPREPLMAKHAVGYATYGDSNRCMLCDRNQIWRSVYGDTDPELAKFME